VTVGYQSSVLWNEDFVQRLLV